LHPAERRFIICGMVDRKRLTEELRKLKHQIQNDPEVRALYDIDGDGQISGEEWDMARKATIAHLEAEQARREADPHKLMQVAGEEVVSGLELAEPAGRVFDQIKESRGSHMLPPDHPFSQPQLMLKQLETRTELFFNVESANAYRIMSGAEEVGYAAETETGLLGTIARNFWGNRRNFTMGIKVRYPCPDIWLKRKLTFILSRIEVSEGPDPIGQIQQVFSFFRKRYDITPYFGGYPLTIIGPVFKPWTFEIKRGERSVGKIEKKWTGLFKESFTREDNFRISFDDPALTGNDRKLIVATAICIDMDHFEHKRQRF
jgi:uncharacterized protein YxjI